MSSGMIKLILGLVVVVILGGVGALWHLQNASILVQPVFSAPWGGMGWRLEQPVALPVLVWASAGAGFLVGFLFLTLPSWIKSMRLNGQLKQARRSAGLASSGLES